MVVLMLRLIDIKWCFLPCPLQLRAIALASFVTVGDRDYDPGRGACDLYMYCRVWGGELSLSWNVQQPPRCTQ